LTQEFKINFYNDVPDIRTDVPNLETQFEKLKSKPQVGKDFRFELDSPFEDKDGDALNYKVKMRALLSTNSTSTAKPATGSTAKPKSTTNATKSSNTTRVLAT